MSETKAKRQRRAPMDNEGRLREATSALMKGYEDELRIGHDKYWYGERAAMIEHKWGRFYR